MAHILKLKVVAEGVETKGQEALLESQGCDEMQGFLFSKPVQRRRVRKAAGVRCREKRPCSVRVALALVIGSGDQLQS